MLDSLRFCLEDLLLHIKRVLRSRYSAHLHKRPEARLEFISLSNLEE